MNLNSPDPRRVQSSPYMRQQVSEKGFESLNGLMVGGPVSSQAHAVPSGIRMLAPNAGFLVGLGQRRLGMATGF